MQQSGGRDAGDARAPSADDVVVAALRTIDDATEAWNGERAANGPDAAPDDARSTE